MATPSEISLEEAAEDVKLHKIHDEEFFSELDKFSTFDQFCNGIRRNVRFNPKKVEDVCIKLIRHLYRLSKANSPKHSNYCNYIRYWLFEQIGVLCTSESGSIGDEAFFKELIDTWKQFNMLILRNKCSPEEIKGVKLSELKKRIFSVYLF
ncbi:hypothetical protein PCYB_006080 [Plasmodium cynomolgi strain B]|uniref:CYIR protein n=1 Tax=Plasmodium cynomolgi (strain B) TaxID=1120755 RepID=K6V0J9_PLACD|nr:hypothetical protein PCYB_006080 [Plasmodium cynomolgi strain B]GAB69859.1 hypothetical protein PCYB_006080 [Plasmodium cynomolgi strain B]